MGKNTRSAAAKGKLVGKLSGIDLSGVAAAPRDAHGMQDFGAMLAAAANAPIVGPANESNDTIASRVQAKPKRQLRYSIDTGDGDAAAAAASAPRSPNRTGRGAGRAEDAAGQGRHRKDDDTLKMARKVAAVAWSRRDGPLSPSALSEATTASPSPPKEKRGKGKKADAAAEESEEKEDGNETPLREPNLGEHFDEEDVDFPQPDEDDIPPPASPNEDADDEGDDDDDDDLAPPPPQPDSPRDEPAAEEAEEEADEPEFPAGEDGYGDDYNDDGDKEGKNYRMADDDEDKETESEDESPSNRSRDRHRRLKKAAPDGSSSDGSGHQPSSATASRSKKKKHKKKSKAPRSDSETESDGSTHQRAKKSKTKKSKRAPKDSDDDSTNPPRKKKKATKSKFSTTFSPKGVPLPRTYHTSPLRHDDDSDAENRGLRRSRRARIAPLAYWKGETIEYGPNDVFDSDLYDGTARTMPVPIGIRKSEPTPYKKRVRKLPTTTSKKSKGKKQSPSETVTPSRGEEMKAFDTRRLRRKYKFADGEETLVWDDTENQIASLKVISYPDNLHFRTLPVRTYREPHEGSESGQAAQSFNVMHDHPDYPSYLMGTLILPPGGVKDPEGVGRSAQTFTVLSCQPNALEIAFGDPDEEEGSFEPDTATRFFLRPHATFRIPPGNCYRIENHSDFAEAKLTWTIIRKNAPESLPNDADDDSGRSRSSDGEAGDDDDNDEEEEGGGKIRSTTKTQRGRRGGSDDDSDSE